VDEDVQPIGREPLADGRADGAAAAGDERAPPHLPKATVSRPVASVRPAAATSKR